MWLATSVLFQFGSISGDMGGMGDLKQLGHPLTFLLKPQKVTSDGMLVFVTDTLPTCWEVGTSINIDPGLEPAVVINIREKLSIFLPDFSRSLMFLSFDSCGYSTLIFGTCF